jgi:hypothetical protein
MELLKCWSQMMQWVCPTRSHQPPNQPTAFQRLSLDHQNTRTYVVCELPAALFRGSAARCHPPLMQNWKLPDVSLSAKVALWITEVTNFVLRSSCCRDAVSIEEGANRSEEHRLVGRPCLCRGMPIRQPHPRARRHDEVSPSQCSTLNVTFYFIFSKKKKLRVPC